MVTVALEEIMVSAELSEVHGDSDAGCGFEPGGIMRGGAARVLKGPAFATG
ncbi:hypothetical protein RR46_13331 [Papilio xuthus]|uniref:Uncharacterized protein n=1 Tax=Papilio xuthus TaxID=66420 RepID=A0A194PLX9_PAPXU|nr:hypothetical protein RR46_13331 [Papilio xuthus]